MTPPESASKLGNWARGCGNEANHLRSEASLMLEKRYQPSLSAFSQPRTYAPSRTFCFVLWPERTRSLPRPKSTDTLPCRRRSSFRENSPPPRWLPTTRCAEARGPWNGAPSTRTPHGQVPRTHRSEKCRISAGRRSRRRSTSARDRDGRYDHAPLKGSTLYRLGSPPTHFTDRICEARELPLVGLEN
jgi:hypothetical protein